MEGGSRARGATWVFSSLYLSISLSLSFLFCYHSGFSADMSTDRRWEYSNSRTPAAVAARQRDGPDAIARFTRQAASHYYGAISLAKEIRDPATLAILSAALAAAAQLAGLWCVPFITV